MKIVYLRGALRDLAAIHTYIARDNPEAANTVVKKIQYSTSRLVSLPYSGRLGPRDTRLLSVPGLPYVVIHRVSGDTVKIVAIFHTARNRRF
jgi:toxin ParE1/3/4